MPLKLTWVLPAMLVCTLSFGLVGCGGDSGGDVSTTEETKQESTQGVTSNAPTYKSVTKPSTDSEDSGIVTTTLGGEAKEDDGSDVEPHEDPTPEVEGSHEVTLGGNGNPASSGGGAAGGGGESTVTITQDDVDGAFTDEVEVATPPAQTQEQQQMTEVMTSAEPSAPSDVSVSAPGTRLEANSRGSIDYSNMEQGYVMVGCFSGTGNRLKALVDGPTTQYQYDIQGGTWVALPLSDGNGTYKITLYENVRGSSYAELVSLTTNVNLADPFAPFRRSNQYVNIANAPNTVATASQVCAGAGDALSKVAKVYDFVVKGFTYDQGKAASVQSGYLPDLDRTLAERRGICFDYAALMTGMLRSQGVPCKLVVGYAGSAYHAWIDVWTEQGGWVSGAVYFDGNSWKRMDPTFASSGGQSDAIMQYIGDGSNYVAKYFY